MLCPQKQQPHKQRSLRVLQLIAQLAQSHMEGQPHWKSAPLPPQQLSPARPLPPLPLLRQRAAQAACCLGRKCWSWGLALARRALP